MDMRGLCCTFLFAELGWGWAGPAGADPPISDGSLKPVAAFSAIQDESQRPVALFTEAARVIESPRGMNCHPVSRQPTQGDDLHPHVPFMRAGPDDHGAPGLPFT
jgi:hypothetical protein